MKQLTVCIAMMFLFLVVITPTVTGTVFNKMYTLQELCDESSHIVIVDVKSAESFWADSDQKHVQTRYSFKIVESLKGNMKEKDTFTMLVYGGSINDIRVFALGLPQFKTGNKALVFLKTKTSKKTGKEYYSVVGASQGNFKIIDDDLVVRDMIQEPLKLQTEGLTLNLSSDNSMRLNDIKSHVNYFVK